MACHQGGGGRCDLEIFSPVWALWRYCFRICRVKVVSPWCSWCVFTTDEKKKNPLDPLLLCVSLKSLGVPLQSFSGRLRFWFSCSALWVVLHRFCPTVTRSTCRCGLHLTHGASIRHLLCHQMRLHLLKHDISCLVRTLKIRPLLVEGLWSAFLTQGFPQNFTSLASMTQKVRESPHTHTSPISSFSRPQME